jgi:4-alpha-glucanotransferase
VEEYTWWADRLRASLRRVDLLRLDHFRGFDASWSVPAGSEDAIHGRWEPGPGAKFFEAMRQKLGGLPLVAEDLGVITRQVEDLRDQFDLPGMRVLQFAFGDDAKANDYLPYAYINHCVVYTGTHDNDTAVGWFSGSGGKTTQDPEVMAAEREFVLRYVGTKGEEIHWDLIRLALGSVADTAIIPLQDVLGLGSSARMNLPGDPTGNWEWRFTWDQLDKATRDRLADMTAVYHRWNGEIPERLHHFPPKLNAKPVSPAPPVGPDQASSSTSSATGTTPKTSARSSAG